MPLASLTIGNGILVELAAFLDRRGAEYERLRAAAGIDTIVADDARQVFPLNSVIALFEHAAATLADPCMGLAFSREIRIGASGLIGRIVSNAPDLRTGLECAIQYFPIFVTDFHIRAIWDRRPVRFEWTFPDEVQATRCQFNMFLAGSSVRWLRLAAGEAWYPQAMQLEGEEPPCRDLQRATLGPGVSFGASVNAIEMGGEILDLPMRGADSQLFRLLRELAEKWLKEGAHLPGIVGAVRAELLVRLRSNGAELDQIAEILGMPSRRLQWRLEQAGTTFERVRDDTRRSLAEHYLRDTEMPLVDIAHEIGFAEQATFTRAAHRWFDCSPRVYRQESRNLAAASHRSSG